MLPKPAILTARLHPTTQQDIWARSFWVQPRERSLPMEVAIGGRHTATRVIITRTQRRTAVPTMATVIITARLITTTTPALTAGMGVPTARTDPRVGGLVTILTRERTHEAVLSRLLMAPEVQHKHIIHTPALMRRRDKVRVRMLNGAAPTFREETKALPWAIIRLLMEL